MMLCVLQLEEARCRPALLHLASPRRSIYSLWLFAVIRIIISFTSDDFIGSFLSSTSCDLSGRSLLIILLIRLILGRGVEEFVTILARFLAI